MKELTAQLLSMTSNKKTVQGKMTGAVDAKVTEMKAIMKVKEERNDGKIRSLESWSKR